VPNILLNLLYFDVQLTVLKYLTVSAVF